MNDTRVQCAHEVIQHYLRKLIKIPWYFYRIFCHLLFCIDYRFLFKHTTTEYTPWIMKSTPPKFLVSNRLLLSQPKYIPQYWEAIKNNIATENFYKLMPALTPRNLIQPLKEIFLLCNHGKHRYTRALTIICPGVCFHHFIRLKKYT